MRSEYSKEMSAAQQLKGLQDPGGFRLPDAVVYALEAHARLRNVKPPTPDRYDLEYAGTDLTNKLYDGEDADLSAIAQRVHAATIDADLARIAQQVQARAAENSPARSSVRCATPQTKRSPPSPRHSKKSSKSPERPARNCKALTSQPWRSCEPVKSNGRLSCH